ncbi:MAG: hypothetical protein WB696_31695 [Chthoniobacterales bacterium]
MRIGLLRKAGIAARSGHTTFRVLVTPRRETLDQAALEEYRRQGGEGKSDDRLLPKLKVDY